MWVAMARLKQRNVKDRVDPNGQREFLLISHSSNAAEDAKWIVEPFFDLLRGPSSH